MQKFDDSGFSSSRDIIGVAKI